MQRHFYHLLFISTALLGSATQAEDITPSPQLAFGEWITTDGATLLRVVPVAGSLAIHLVRQLPDRLVHPQVTDRHNPNREQRQRQLAGLQLGDGFSLDGDRWRGGRIYDPGSGRNYRANLRMLDPDHLEVRGYVGLEALGRAEIWTRRDHYVRSVSAMLGETCQLEEDS